MNKKILLCITAMLSLGTFTGCSVQLPWQEEEVVESTEEVVETPPPTLEEILGFTGYDLMSQSNDYKFQEVNLKADINLIATVNSRSIKHTISTTTIHQADETKSYDVYTITDVDDVETKSGSRLSYVIVGDNVEYVNTNYTGWGYKSYQTDSEYYTYNVESPNIDVTLFEQQSPRLYVEGSITVNSSSSIGKYVLSVLNEYGGVTENPVGTFRAIFDEDTHDMLMMTVNLENINITYEGNSANISSMTVTVTSVTNNNDDVVTIPQYALNTDRYISDDNNEEVIQEVEQINEFDTEVPLCTSLFELEQDDAVIDDYLTQLGLNADVIQEQYNCNGESVMLALRIYLKEQSYNSFTTMETDDFSDDQNCVYSIISGWLPDIVTVTE
jgi:hypothetical protein